MSLALARKYRPATFDDLIGQESVSQTLSLALDGNRLSHAYLFSGLRGSGKTSTARIFAKALLCEKGETSHPCGVCGHCVMAGESRHLDIIEMDAASNRGIDDIKDLIEHTKYKPSSARYKIFIIDEVHMLTPQAFNALLKTLEEPPSFVKFILATTDPLKLPATILSRTQHFRFKKIPQNLVLKHLEHILELENIGYEIEALDIIARSGAGSLRDSLTLLDQAIVYSKNFVDVNTITGMLGIIEPSQLETLIADIMNKDISKILRFITMAGDYESEMILDELTLYLKELLLSGQKAIHSTIIERFFRVIAESKGLLALGSDGEFVLALALFKMVESLDIKDIDTMIRGLEQELSGVEIAPTLPMSVAQTRPIPPTTTTHNRFEAIIEMVRTLESEVLGATIPTPIEVPKVITEKVVIEEVAKEESKEESDESFFDNPFGDDEEEMREEYEEEYSEEEIKEENIGLHTFEILRQKLYSHNAPLGEAFTRNITFESFQDHTLTWTSTAEEADKQMLITYWGLIKNFVQETFGVETKIVNLSKKKMN